MKFIINPGGLGWDLASFLKALPYLRPTFAIYACPISHPIHHSMAFRCAFDSSLRSSSFPDPPQFQGWPFQKPTQFIPNINSVGPEVTNLTLFQMKTADETHITTVYSPYKRTPPPPGQE